MQRSVTNLSHLELISSKLVLYTRHAIIEVQRGTCASAVDENQLQKTIGHTLRLPKARKIFGFSLPTKPSLHVCYNSELFSDEYSSENLIEFDIQILTDKFVTKESWD